jgi:hypothetical protein
MIVFVIIWSKLLVISLIKLTFQMVGTTRSSPNGFGASGSGDLPPPPPMTLTEAFMATQTEVLRQILQTQQQITQQMNRGPPHGANHEGPNQVTTYAQFIAMKPPTFAKEEDPPEAEAWVKAIEAKFSAFVLPCSKENKANFAALQLRGEALMWWDHFKSMQRGHAVTWDEFKQAFKSHHIPKGLMDRKMRELLDLRQGSDSVYRYAQKFNSLCQYGGHHVDPDAKKMERFRDGLDGKLYERMNLLEPANFHELVNKAISQEDAMKKSHGDNKRMSGSTPGSGTGKKFRFVKKEAPGPSHQSSTGRWMMKPPQSKPAGNLQFRSAQQQALKPILAMLEIVVATTVASQGTTLVSVQSPGRSSPTRRIRVQEASLPLRPRSLWCKCAEAS